MSALTVATTATAATALPILIGLRNLVVPDSIFTIMVGLLILLVSLIPKHGRNVDDLSKLGLRTAVAVGLVQGLSIVPGVSRSGVTISALLVLGFSLYNALRLSYLLSIPAVAGAQVSLPLFLGVKEISLEMVVGAAVAMLIGFLTISFFLKASLTHDVKIVTVPLAVFLVATGFLLVYLGG